MRTDRRKTFFHSSYYTANPIACAAAVANLEIWRSEPVFERIREVKETHWQQLARFEGDARFTGIRQAGTIAALDLVVPASGYLAEAGPRMRKMFRDRSLLVRPLGNVLYLMPPYCVTPQELACAYDASTRWSRSFWNARDDVGRFYVHGRLRSRCSRALRR